MSRRGPSLLALLAVLLPAGPVAAARSAAGGPVGCGYGQSGANDTTLCWIDMSAIGAVSVASG